MSEKRKRQRRRAADAAKAGTKLALNLIEIVRAEIGEFLALDVPPHELSRVQIRGVAGQALDREPGALAAQVFLHRPTLMRRQPIPDQDDSPTAHLSLQVVQELDEGHVVVTARARLEEETAATEVPSVGHREGDGEFLPIEGVDQDRGFATRRPGPADRRALRDAAFVLEDDPGAAPPSVFFTVGQRVVIQY